MMISPKIADAIVGNYERPSPSVGGDDEVEPEQRSRVCAAGEESQIEGGRNIICIGF